MFTRSKSMHQDNASHHSQQLHAHFQVPSADDDLSSHDSNIVLEPFDNVNEKYNVRLGFLQIKHVYEVRFHVEDTIQDDLISDPLQNLNVKVESTEILSDGRGHVIVMTFRAVKEKIMQEIIVLNSKSDPNKTLTLILHARVLGKGKGTPSLKKGIHCVKIEWDEESDASDWQEHLS